MEKIKYFIGFLCLALVLAATSCSDINKMQQEFLDRGEKIYVGKIDSLSVRGGLYRVEISGLMRYAQTAEKCMVRWGSDSVLFSIEHLTTQDTMRIILDNIQEGGHLFYVQTYDLTGNTSLNETCYGYAYGENYILSADSKLIVEMNPKADGIELVWNKSDEAIAVELSYDSNDGEKHLQLAGNVDTLLLSNWKVGGSTKYRTTLIPEKNSLDTLYTDWQEQAFPSSVEYAVEKDKIQPLYLSSDATTGHGGSVSGVFDGKNDASHQFHSADGVNTPQHLTFDLGQYVTLTNYEWWGRDDYFNWNPMTVQLWGIEDIAGAEIMLSSSDPNWESEATTKGWVKLTENTITGNGIYSSIQEVQTQKKVRYLIIRTTDVHAGTGDGTYVIIREMNLFANEILPIN